MRHLDQPWSDARAMPVYERRWYVQRLLEDLKREAKDSGASPMLTDG